MSQKLSKYLLVVILLGVSGCVSIPTQTVQTHYPEPERRGIYHKVNPGETIWRIAKSYNVSIEDVIESNNIPDVAKVEKNQLIFIPGASERIDIIIDTKASEKEFIWPVKGKIIKYFGDKRSGVVSKGIDIKTQEGASVKAARTGKVVFADYLSGYGNMLILDHQDGFFSIYAQNAKLLVKVGQLIYKNTPIAHVGAKNHLAYLHFEIRKNTVEANPLYYLP
jgi:murein DD-endopeptidase MepM/ murein hydrolase activator NlpD